MQSRCLSEGILYTNRSLTFELYRLHSCCMKFAADSLPMLTALSIEELQKLDMPVLVDMLAYQTSIYLRLMKSSGVQDTIQVYKDSIANIQSAIHIKKDLENNSTNSSSSISFTQDATE
jgi:hypothetical protein